MDNQEGCVQMSQQSRRLPLEASTSQLTEALQHLAERKKRDHLLVILAGFDTASGALPPQRGPPREGWNQRPAFTAFKDSLMLTEMPVSVRT